MTDTDTAPAGKKLPVEQIAKARGLLPQFMPGKPAKATSSGTVLAGQAPKANKSFWKFRAAQVRFGWAEGFLITEDDFDAAIELVSSITLR